MDGILRRIDALTEGLAVIGVLSYCAAAAVSVADVAGRRFGVPVLGVVDLVQMFVMAGAWLSIPWAFTAGAHVGVEFLLDKLPPRLARGFQALAALAAVGIMGLILWKCWGAWRMQAMLGDRSQQLGIPMSFFWLPLLAGSVASILAAGATAVRLATGRAIAATQAH